MQQLAKVSVKLSIIFVWMIFSFQIALGQQNPNFDNTVGLVPEGWTPSPSLPVIEVITGEDGFDNFYLGVDLSEPHISANPLNPLEYFTAFNINGAHYTHNGYDWTATSPPFGVAPNGDPVTAYDSLGNLYYETMYGGIVGCKVIRSTDNGITWSDPVTAISGVDKNWIACDQTAGPYANYVYTTMTAGPGGNFARSTDFGASWQNTWNFSTQSAPGMMVAVGPDVMGGNNISGGCVYVVTNGGSATGHVYSFYVSHDGGQTFTFKSTQNYANYVGTFVNGRNSVENMRVRPYPFITADNSFGPYRGRLYLVYTSNNPPGNGNKPDVFCRYSDDQGQTWSAEIIINDDAFSEGNHQFHPAPWCDKETGRLYVKWFDSRNVPTSDSAEVYASYSDDGGITWAPNQNLSTEKFKIDCTTCGSGTPRYQGDYDAITSNRYSAMAVWSDFRDGSFGSYVAYFPDFAVKVPEEITFNPTDSISVFIKVPAVKLYEHSVKFSIESAPAENFTIDFPQGDSLAAYPDSLLLTIKADSVPFGNYELILKGEGPNGTPVHVRNINLNVTGPQTFVIAPNGGESLFVGGLFTITWDKILVDSVRIDYSTDGGDSWTLITEDGGAGSPAREHPKLRFKAMNVAPPMESVDSYEWIVPNTVSDSCLVRVSDKGDSTVFDVSDSPFTIIGAPQPIWRAQNSGADSILLSVSVLDTLNAWAAGLDGFVARTANGGKTWQSVSGNVGGDVYAVTAITNTRALAAVNDANGAKIRRTFNSGIYWQTTYQSTDPGAFINAIEMFDENNGYAMGDPVSGNWTLLSTTNGGASWSVAATLPQDGAEAGWNNSMDWINDQYGWFGTNNNRIYYTTDGGANWSFSTTSFANSYSVAFATGLLGIAAGDQIDRSTDGGNNWTPAGGTLSGDIFASAGLNLVPERWYVITGSEIHRSDDHGENFTVDYTHSTALQHLDMKVVDVDGNDWIVGYAVGSQGTIVKYLELVTVTGIEDGETAVPAVFSLRQNYPNPFNPATTIAYTLPERAEVNLKIVNLLGQEVRTLTNTTQDAGAYQVKWDGRSNSGVQTASGVYFYKLEAKAQNGKIFSGSRKMLLLK